MKVTKCSICGSIPADCMMDGHVLLCKGCFDRLTFKGGVPDAVEHPSHYTAHPSGVECIQITEHMNFCRGNAMKYLWRAGSKGDELEDIKKARWYLDREIARLEKK